MTSQRTSKWKIALMNKVNMPNIFSRIGEKYYFEIRLISYLQNSTFDQFVKVYLAILPCSFCHVYGNIIDYSGYIPGRDFLISAGNSNRIFRNPFTSWFLNFQVYRDFLLNIWHLKNYKRKDSNSHHPPYPRGSCKSLTIVSVT